MGLLTDNCTPQMAQTESGLIVPLHIIKKPKRPIAFDCFCGAGGMGCGVIQAGWEIVGANEFDAAASHTYMVNLGHWPMNIHYLDGEEGKRRFNEYLMRSWGIKKKDCGTDGELTPDALKKAFGDELLPKRHFAGSGWIKHTDSPGVRNFWFGDVRKLKGNDILNTLGLRQGDIDAVFGGPPCQGFSKSGKQNIADPRNNLVYEFARLIVELQPKTFVMEEVPDVAYFYDPDGVPVLDKFCLMLQEGGYGKWEMIKKSLSMQTGSAAVIRGDPKPITKPKTATKAKKAKDEATGQQMIFDDEADEAE